MSWTHGARLGLAVLAAGTALEWSGWVPRVAGQEAEDRWRRATGRYEFSFPRDHASHPDYKIEWWYYTGHLQSQDGRRFGYQVTFFRLGVAFEPGNPSRWAVRDLHLAHLAVTEVDAERFRFAERLNRAGIGLAGAETARYRVWNDDWSVEALRDGTHHLRAADEGIGLDLRLRPDKAPVAHGEEGISQKGSAAGNATHYYSVPRMGTTGSLILDGRTVRVTGTSWMDHEFGTSFLEEGQVGWDWFWIQLEDGSDLMLFQIRRADGSRDVHSSATLVDAAGEAHPIGRDGFELEPVSAWRSEASGASYPIVWRLRLPAARLDLTVRALVEDQELRGPRSGVVYWEGATEASGERAGSPAAGRGYLEMTGYAGPSMSRLLR